MKRLSWIAFCVAIIAVAGCQKIGYKPYLPEEYRGDPKDPSPTQSGILTGKRGEYVIYGR